MHAQPGRPVRAASAFSFPPRFPVVALVLFAAAFLAGAGHAKGSRSRFSFENTDGLEIINTKVEAVTYRGRKAVRLLDQPGQIQQGVANGNTIAVLTGTDFNEGTIEVDVAGGPRTGAEEGARGFIGIAFHVRDGGSRFDCFYLRPTNGRAEDQLRRNHATQFIAEPEFPWQRLRKEFPGVYESYVDLEAGAWTHLRIEVAGGKARLYVNGAKQPTLLVNDVKHGPSHGPVALWIGQDTDGYFSNLAID